MKEAIARIKINKLLEEVGWRFFADASGPANVILEPNVKVAHADIEALGSDFEKLADGFIDFLLLDQDAGWITVGEGADVGEYRSSAARQGHIA